MRLVFLFLLIFTTKTLSIEYYKNGTGKPVLFVIAGIHGDEKSPIEFLNSIKDMEVSNGTIVIIPCANNDAVKKNVRTEYFTTDLNRSFFQNNGDKTDKIAKDIVELIEKYDATVVLDFHESWYNYDENQPHNLYMGNTIIFSKESSKILDDLILDISVNNNLLPVGWPIEGSLANEIPKHLNIPVLTVETSREDTIKERKKKYRNILEKTMRYLKME